MRGAAYVARGLAWQKKGDNERALADFDGAIAMNPKDALAYNDRGMLWRERGDPDRAIDDFTAAIAIDPMPHSDEAYSGRGNAVVARPNVNIYENRALTLLEKSDLDGAIADFDRAIKLDPRGADSFNGRGAAFRGHLRSAGPATTSSAQQCAATGAGKKSPPAAPKEPAAALVWAWHRAGSAARSWHWRRLPFCSGSPASGNVALRSKWSPSWSGDC